MNRMEGSAWLEKKGREDLLRLLEIPMIAFFFAREECQDYPDHSEDLGVLFWLLVLMVQREQQGHTCHPLRAILETWDELWEAYAQRTLEEGKLSMIRKPDLASQVRNLPKWYFHPIQSGEGRGARGYLWESGSTQVLYLEKNWHFQERLVTRLAALISSPSSIPTGQADRELSLENHQGVVLRPNLLQARAISGALKSQFFVLSGGPGTGKTTTLALLIKEYLSVSANLPERIALLAPTGRAASRMAESLESSGLKILPKVGTLHGILGIREFQHDPVRHHSGNPLPYDLVVVDESSMMDLRIFGLLLEALGPKTSLLLIGDKDQLPSVDSGAVLGDILECLNSSGRSEGSYEILLESRRNSGQILSLSRAMVGFGEENGRHKEVSTLAPAQLMEPFFDSRPVSKIWESLGKGEVLWSEPSQGPMDLDGLVRHLCSQGVWRDLVRLNSKAIASVDELGARMFSLMDDTVFLSLVHDGPWGTKNINQLALEELGRGQVGAGIPILITKNDPDLGLMNGERGLSVYRKDKRLCVVFPGKNRMIPLSLIRSWDFGWAMTVHKSQGSEFGRVALILPQRLCLRVSRELIYTGITRAKDSALILAGKEVLYQGLSKRLQRDSQISEFLRSQLEGSKR